MPVGISDLRGERSPFPLRGLGDGGPARHGVEVDGPEGDTIFCCAHCARASTGLDQLRDRAAQSPRATPDAG